MNIQYLKSLQDNPADKGKTIEWVNEPISITEIETLEATYNHGNPFPLALRELLYLAGQNCYILDYCRYDTQAAMQEAHRGYLLERAQSISRPFYIIDCSNHFDQFLFVYLDEGDNPCVYEFSFEDGDLHLVNYSLQSYVDSQIATVKEGLNPF